MQKTTVIKLVVIVGVFIVCYYLASSYITLDMVQRHSAAFKGMVDTNYARAVLVYLASVVGCIASSLPVMIPLALVGGFLFGAVAGSVLATVGTWVGCLISFMLIRYLMGTLALGRRTKQLEGFNIRMKEYGLSYLLVLHYSGIIPLFVINSVAAVSAITLLRFALITFLGVLPVASVYAFAGRQLSTIESVGDVFSPSVIMALVLLMMLALVPMLIKRFRGSAEV